MALNLVPLVLDLYDGGGNLIASGTASLTPTSSLVDATDNVYVTQSPLVVNFKVGASPLVEIVPTDNTNIEPEGWAWQITFDNVPGDPPSYEFAIPGSGYVYSYTATFASPAVFTAAGSSLANGTPVVLAGSTPTLLGAFWPNTIYYVVDASGDTFSLASSVGGSAIASTSSGSGEVAVVQYLSSLTMIDDVQSVIPIPVSAGGTGSPTQNWQGLLTPTTQMGAYTATAGQLVKANIASSSWTLTLPTAPPANTIIGAKVMANASGNTHALTVACGSGDFFEQSGGGTSVTMSLPLQAAAWQYNSGYWTRISDDLPLGQLDNRYQKVFSPLTYGAAGNGTTDDTTAVQAAFAAAGAAYGTVDLGNYKFLTSSPVVLTSGISVQGCSNWGTAGVGAGQITNNASDVFNCSAGVGNLTFTNVVVIAHSSAGHIFNLSTAGYISASVFTGCLFIQDSVSKAIIYGNGTDVTFIGNYIGMGTELSQAPNTTVSAITLITGAAAVNNNTFERVEIEAGVASGAGVPFFHIEQQGGGYCTDNTFRDILAEQCYTGLITLLSCQACTIEQVSVFDTTTFYNSLFTIGTSSAGGSSASQNIVIRNSGRRGGSLQSGCYDVSAPAASVQLENVGPLSGSPSYNLLASDAIVLYANAGAQSSSIPGLVVPNYFQFSSVANFLPFTPWASATFSAQVIYFSQILTRGGVAVSNALFQVNVSSGNMNIGVWANSGGVPGTLYTSTGSFAVPATGAKTQALAASCTPNVGDWVGFAVDNTTASFYSMTNSQSGWGAYWRIVGEASTSALALASNPTVTTTSINMPMFLLF